MITFCHTNNYDRKTKYYQLDQKYQKAQFERIHENGLYGINSLVYKLQSCMGICENSDHKNILYTTKSLFDSHSAINATRYYFSTEPLTKLDAECLLVFSNQSHSISKSLCIKRLLSKPMANRIAEDYRIFMKGRKLAEGDHAIFNLNISGLQFTKMAVMHLPEKLFLDLQKTQGNPPKGGPFFQLLRNAIQKILKQGIKSLIIGEFEWKGWVNKSNGFQSMAAVLKQFDGLKVVVFACESEDSQLMYMQAVQDQRKDSKL